MCSTVAILASMRSSSERLLGVAIVLCGMSSHPAAMAAFLGTESPSFAADKKGEPAPPWRRLLYLPSNNRPPRPSSPPRAAKKSKTETARASDWLPAKDDWQRTQDEWEVGQESAPSSFGVLELAVDVEQEPPQTEEEDEPEETWDAGEAEHVQEEEEEEKEEENI
jgi:hypothetical protein